MFMFHSRDGEAKTTLSCIDKAKNIFGWEPKFNVKDWIGEK
jgi:UDP-glucose 4-epimerase